MTTKQKRTFKTPTPAETERGLAALRRVLRDMRWDDQGGYVGYRGAGRWSFISTGLPQTTPDDLNALFALAGFEPDVIVPKGDCKNCRNAKDGREQGFRTRECATCRHPRMSNFEPRAKNQR